MTIKNQKQNGESLQPDFTDEEDEVGEEDATSGSPFFSFLFIFNNNKGLFTYYASRRRGGRGYGKC